jgi:hypothetical protein
VNLAKQLHENHEKDLEIRLFSSNDEILDKHLLPVDDLKQITFLCKMCFFLNCLLVVCKRILNNSIRLDGNDCTKPPNDPAIK